MAAVLEKPAVARIPALQISHFARRNPDELIDLRIMSPVHVSRILESAAAFVDMAYCVEGVDRRGWEQYSKQRADGMGGFVAQLSPQLRSSRFRDIPYDEEFHRLVAVPGEPGVFRGSLYLDGSAITLTDRLEFSAGQQGVTARLTRERPGDFRKTIELSCEHN